MPNAPRHARTGAGARPDHPARVGRDAGHSLQKGNMAMTNRLKLLALLGLCLGLTLADKIIEAHGGTIEVESQLGVGSIFRILLPVQ